MAKVAVLFHSQDGNTRKVADELKHMVGADLVELKIPGTEGLHGGMKYIRLGFMAVFGLKPGITGGRDLSEYDTIILGTPVWAGTFSPALRSYLSRRSLYGASIGAYFCHSGGLRSAPARLAEFLNLGSDMKYATAREPKVNNTARELADLIAMKMGLVEKKEKKKGVETRSRLRF